VPKEALPAFKVALPKLEGDENLLKLWIYIAQTSGNPNIKKYWYHCGLNLDISLKMF
jgi:hypothetical protein